MNNLPVEDIIVDIVLPGTQIYGDATERPTSMFVGILVLSDQSGRK